MFFFRKLQRVHCIETREQIKKGLWECQQIRNTTQEKGKDSYNDAKDNSQNTEM
jgi:hypothetical protein